MAGMQAHVLLQGMYVGKLQNHLNKKEAKKKKSKKILGDGMPRLMSGDDVFAMIKAAEEQAVQDAAEKAERKTARDAHGEALAKWKVRESERKARNEEKRRIHQEAVKAWEVERDLAKPQGHRARWTKPKLGKLEKPIPRPRKPMDEDIDDEEEAGDDVEEAEEEEND